MSELSDRLSQHEERHFAAASATERIRDAFVGPPQVLLPKKYGKSGMRLLTV